MDTARALKNVVSSSVASGVRKPGEICWINIVTPRLKEACDFFGALLGWKMTPMPGMRDGLMVHVEGHAIGAMADQCAPDTPKGTPAFIGVAIKVESADATCERVNKLGGTTRVAPFDVMDAGRIAVCADPSGAQFDVWQPKKHVGTDVDSRLPGAPTWFEARTDDADRSSAFYAGVFGWTPETVAPPGMRYTTFFHGGRAVAGMMQCPPEMKIEPHWATFFASDDVDASARKAVELGATMCMPPTDIPGIGRFCVLTSPQGVTFQLLKYVSV